MIGLVAVDRPTSVADALAEGRTRLRAAGVASPAQDTRLLLQHAANLSASDVIARPETRLSRTALDAFRRALARREAREPVARILARRAFVGIEIEIGAGCLVPRPETETLVEVALDLASKVSDAPSIADFGTGPGTVLLALLDALPRARGTGIDLSDAAIGFARRNADRLGLSPRASFTHGDMRTWRGPPADLLVSNPPYIPTADIDRLEPEVARHDPRLALDGGADGYDLYRTLAADLARHVRPGGAAAVEVGHGQAETVARLFEAVGHRVVEVRRDLLGIERVVAVRPAHRP